ncbi:MAG: hypothetical protein AAB897_02450 [Patescibacteria group bacterium]
MPSFILAFALIVLVISLVFIGLQEEIRSSALDIIIQLTETKLTPPTPSEPESATSTAVEPAAPEPKWVPEGFIGPSGEPKIIGPSGNPPNY